jgi:hypothetical protein
MDGPQGDQSAREVLRDWARAPGYSKRAAEFLELARCAALPGVRKRYVAIAEHYRALAAAEKRVQIKKNRTSDPMNENRTADELFGPRLQRELDKNKRGAD